MFIARVTAALHIVDEETWGLILWKEAYRAIRSFSGSGTMPECPGNCCDEDPLTFVCHMVAGEVKQVAGNSPVR